MLTRTVLPAVQVSTVDLVLTCVVKCAMTCMVTRVCMDECAEMFTDIPVDTSV